MTAASFHTDSQGDQCALYLGGRWQLGDAPDGDALQAVIPPDCQHLDLITEQLESWDSSLAIALLQLARWCDSQKISLNTDAVPQGLQQLLNLATGVPVYQTEAAEKSDNAITILAYLGSVQLRQLGAQVYVADLVAIGMVREMGALMTAVIMAGRTGAAYAAQLGTMQVNEEIDALRIMGISSMEFLVLPRLLALVFVMPLLCIYADIIGMVGGAIIATSMDVSIIQYISQTRDAVDWLDISTGIVKSIVFVILIAIAGCQAGLNCGRNSDAVGMAATNAVVKAIVYLVVADAAFNILYDKLGI